MSKSKYVDISSIVQIIGSIYNHPQLLEADDKYFFNEEDFVDNFHKIIFGTIYNLYQHGAKSLTLSSIEDYLEQRPKAYSEYKANKGSEYLLRCSENNDFSSFDYYYNKMKKMTLLRGYEKIGMDMSYWYDPDTLDLKIKQRQEDWLDNHTLEEIANEIDDKILSIRMKYVDNVSEGGVQAGEGIDKLLKDLKETPEIGYPLYGDYINTVVRGARLKKFYLRSASTGTGKSRSMVADACYIGCSQMYDLNERKWISTGASQSTIFIATEQDLSEVQTMMVAFLSGVNEEHILTSEYYEGEWERVCKAAMLLKNGKIYFESLPDFSLQDIENTIKRGVREHDARYVMLDYLHTSMKILEEITKRSGGVRLREDNVLFMLSIKLKDLCNQYGIFIMSATQLNGEKK